MARIKFESPDDLKDKFNVYMALNKLEEVTGENLITTLGIGSGKAFVLYMYGKHIASENDVLKMSATDRIAEAFKVLFPVTKAESGMAHKKAILIYAEYLCFASFFRRALFAKMMEHNILFVDYGKAEASDYRLVVDKPIKYFDK